VHRPEITLGFHALLTLQRRGIPRSHVLAIVRDPEEIVAGRFGREVRQALAIRPADGKEVLLRVVVEVGADRIQVITAYWTSRIVKYRRRS